MAGGRDRAAIERRLVIFGATGDLAQRYLAPALGHLETGGRLAGLEIVGAGREDWTDDDLRTWLGEGISAFAPEIGQPARRALLDRVRYRPADVTDAGSVAEAVPTDRPVVVYLALPPAVFAPAIEALGTLGLPPGSRVVVEKPFGTDLESARALNRVAHAHFPEDAIFRVDHFLGMQTVQNLVGLRFGNRMIEPLFEARHVERIDIVWDETLTLEGRAGYYDRAGALRDMLQNHLLQVLSLVAMEAPAALTPRDLRNRKVELLRSVRRLSPQQAARRSVRARYGPGSVQGRAVPAYVDEPGVDPGHGTETFAQVTLAVDSWRWEGVPFTLRSGKALAEDRREVVVHFRPSPLPSLCGETAPNLLRILLEPDGLGMRLNLNVPGEPFELRPVTFRRDLPGGDVPAYVHVLDAVLGGDATLSIRWDEAEESWEIVEPVMQAWASDAVPLASYPAGSTGPAPVAPLGP